MKFSMKFAAKVKLMCESSDVVSPVVALGGGHHCLLAQLLHTDVREGGAAGEDSSASCGRLGLGCGALRSDEGSIDCLH